MRRLGRWLRGLADRRDPPESCEAPGVTFNAFAPADLEIDLRLPSSITWESPDLPGTPLVDDDDLESWRAGIYL